MKPTDLQKVYGDSLNLLIKLVPNGSSPTLISEIGHTVKIISALTNRRLP